MADPFSNPYAHSHYPRAALAVWVSAGLLLVLSVCCVGGMTMLAVVPLNDLKQMEGMEEVPAETWKQMEQAQPQMAGKAVAAAFTTLLPALTLLVLGFFVRNGRRGATITAQVLCWIVLTLLTLNLVFSLPAMTTAGVAGVLGLLTALALGGVLFWAIKSLRLALRSPAPGAADAFDHPPRVGSPDDDPWEHLL